ncbi:MAG: DnaB-like helicase N-terminal domain-containing protein [Acidimicrobiales bacterium]
MKGQAHSPAAEKAMLGTALLAANARSVLRTQLDPADFYIPAHAHIAEAIVALDALSAHVDATTTANWLAERKQLDDVGGPAVLIGLMADAPSTASAATHAAIIRDRAARRKLKTLLVEATARADELAVPVGDLVDDLCGRARAVDAPSGDADTEPDIDAFLDEHVAYDWLVEGLLEKGDRLLLTAGEGAGKALATDTPIRTARGWKTMGDVQVGDAVYHPDGKPTPVVAVTPTMTDRPCYRVTFSDGATVVADADHQWTTHTLACREAEAAVRRWQPTRPRGTDQRHKRTAWPATVTTAEMAATLHARNGHALNHAILTAAPFDAPEATLPVHPYALGVWLGDGTSAGARLTCADKGIIDELAACGEPVRHVNGYRWTWAEPTKRGPRAGRMATRLRALGVVGAKHIPEAYQEASPAQRWALLQGLMDTDGTVGVHGFCEFSVTNRRLAADARMLLLGLGIKATMRVGDANLHGRRIGDRYRLGFVPEQQVFRLARKAERHRPLSTNRSRYRYVTDVEPVGSVPVRCIQVGREDGMYLVGREMIATHNSTLLRQLALQLAAGIHPFRPETFRPVTVLVIDVENSRMQVHRKMSAMMPLVRPGAAVQQQMGQAEPVRFDPRRLRIKVRPQGINLLARADRRWFTERVAGAEPDVVITGPIYKLHRGKPVDEEPAAEVAGYLDELRATYRCALILEAHTPHGNDGGRHRTLRPYGASLWMRWPEFGYGIRPTEDQPGVFDWVAWRGPRDDGRTWPAKLRHGNRWPWINAYGPADHEPGDEPF